jgi:phosphatidate cytidylyltransferase
MIFIFDFQGVSSWVIVLAAACGAVFGQIGDLFESSIKRFCEAKDSGSILPGHGGMLDRVDAVTFAGPVIWCVFKLSGQI